MRTPALLLSLCLAAGAQEAPPLPQLVKLFDAKTGQTIEMTTLVDALAQNEVVFLGESHLDETTHRFELAVYEALIAKTEGKVVLAMEMFERDVQSALDDYLAGKIEEATFRRKARAWGNYRTGYRALVEAAKKHKLPVVASNAPARLRRVIAFGGRAKLDSLPPEERALLPEKLFPNTEAYWERFARVVRGHANMIIGTTPEKRLTSSQSLWDNAMGESCVKALAKHPGHLVLHINGGFHSREREGAVTQVLARRPDTKLVVLEAVAVTDLPGVADWKGTRADFFAACDARTRASSEGFHAVTIAPELRYRLLPPHGSKKAPLLIWLGGDAFRARDGLALWKTALGEEVWIAAIEPPFPHETDDLSLGGRWFWPETFNENVGTMMDGLARVHDYILRNYPVDRTRVMIVGQDTGGAIVAAAALYSGLECPLLAVAPRRHGKLHEMALPEPRKNERKLTVLTRDREWWETEAKEHKTVNRTTDVVDAPASDWDLFADTENRIRATLGLEERPAPEGDARLLILDNDSPRARMWAHRLARRLESEGTPVRVATQGDGTSLDAITPDQLADGRSIPLAAGPFGGTTILYVPKDRVGEQKSAWEQLEVDDVISKRSRFHHVKVCFEGDPVDSLEAALQWVTDKGRRNVLVVPAVFCAAGADMRRWAAEAKDYEDTLTIAWVPGLGGSMRAPPR